MTEETRKKIRLSTIAQKKKRGEKITMLTAYDFSIARLLDRAGVEMLLVGDSAAMVVHGHPNTLPITTESMLDHTAAVCRARRWAFVTADLPFMSYHISHEQAIENSGRFIKEAGAEAVKLEGGLEMVERVRAITQIGIPVMAHIGLSYQRIHEQSGAKVQGRRESDRTYLLESALALQEAGAFSIILELIQEDRAAEITERLAIPTIGIGSGAVCDGQVLVTNDMLGLYDEMTPKFVRRYANLGEEIIKAAQRFDADIKSGSYPSPAESFAPKGSSNTPATKPKKKRTNRSRERAASVH